MINRWDNVLGILSDIPEEEFEAMVNESKQRPNVPQFKGFVQVGWLDTDIDIELDWFMIGPTNGPQRITLKDVKTDPNLATALMMNRFLGGPVYKKVGE